MVIQASAAPVGPLRRVPVQGRSLARVNRILDACATLVDEVGYDGLTTTLLAERAGVAIGSVYQFFPDKRAVVRALTLRNVEAYVERLSRRIEQSDFPNWWDAIDGAIDEYINMHRDTPGFRALHFGDVVDRNLLDDEHDNDAVIAQRLGEVLATGFGLVGEATLALSLVIAVEMTDALIKLAFRRDPDGDEVVLTEVKDIVRGYLYRRVGTPLLEAHSEGSM